MGIVMDHCRAHFALPLLAVLVLVAGGCVGLQPKVGADLSIMGLDPEVAASIHSDNRAQKGIEPKAKFPLRLAVVELERGGRCRDGEASVRVVDPESPEKLRELANLRAVAGMRIIDRRMVSGRQRHSAGVRRAAELAGAEMILIYTIHITDEDTDHLPPLTLFTLGLAPTTTTKGNAVVDALLMDTESGYIYGIGRTEASNTRLSNMWRSGRARDRAIARARQRAVAHLVDHMVDAWEAVIEEYAYSRPRSAWGQR